MSSTKATGLNQEKAAESAEKKQKQVSLPLSPEKSDSEKSPQKKVTMGSGIVTKRISAGGMAIIYEIWNQELEVTRAVKLLRPDHTRESAERFQTEMKISAKLHHPNIIEIYAVGKWNTLPYIEMERIDGFTLEKVIAHAGSLPLEVCTAVAIMVGRALNYAHNQTYVLYGETYKGIIHRDLKPSNVMITRLGTVKLMDFGIAKPVTASIHTCADVVIGTLQYLAPEQLEGKEADYRSDVYSLGTVLYEMLTGRQAFPEAGLAKLVPNKLENVYTPLDMYDLKIPRSLRDIVHRSLRLEPEKRYQSALDLLRAIGQVHKKLTYLSPEQVMAKYMKSPGQQKKVVIRKSSKTPKPLVIWIAASIIISVSTLAAIYYYNPYIFRSIRGITNRFSSQSIQNHYTLAKDMLSQYAQQIQEDSAVLDQQGQKHHDSVQTDSITGRSNNLGDSVIAHSFIDMQESSMPPERIHDHEMSEITTKPPEQLNKQQHTRSSSKQQQSEQHMQNQPQLKVNETTKPAENTTVHPPSLVDRLKFEYGTNDLTTLFISEVEKQEFDTALKVFEHLTKSQAAQTKVQIYRFRALISSGKTAEAKKILVSHHINDGEFLLEKAMYYYHGGQSGKAYQLVQEASRAPVGFMNRTVFRQRLLFTKALCATSAYDSNKTDQTRRTAMEAWFEVKSYLRTSPDHRYFKEADKQIRRISRN